MGCTGSQVPDPNITHGQRIASKPVLPHSGTQRQQNGVQDVVPNGLSKGQVKQNGRQVDRDVVSTVSTSTVATSNGVDLSMDSTNSKAFDAVSVTDSASSVAREPTRTLRGDQSQRHEARISRELRLKDMQKRREEKALKISELVMEETERLSLSTFTNSRATSRSGTPKMLHRGDCVRPGTSAHLDPTTASPVSKSASEGSLPPSGAARPSALKSANRRRRKGEAKVTIVTDMDQSENSSQMDKDGVNGQEDGMVEREISNKEHLS